MSCKADLTGLCSIKYRRHVPEGCSSSLILRELNRPSRQFVFRVLGRDDEQLVVVDVRDRLVEMRWAAKGYFVGRS